MSGFTPPDAAEQAGTDESVHLALAIGQLVDGHAREATITAEQHEQTFPGLGGEPRRRIAASLAANRVNRELENSPSLAAFVRRLLSPEDLGWAVSQEVRDLAKAAMAEAAAQSEPQQARDAARYRYLRSKIAAMNPRGESSWGFVYERFPRPVGNPCYGIVAENFDAAVDAAMAAPRGNA